MLISDVYGVANQLRSERVVSLVEFERTVSKFRKRKRTLLSCVPVLDKT